MRGEANVLYVQYSTANVGLASRETCVEYKEMLSADQYKQKM